MPPVHPSGAHPPNPHASLGGQISPSNNQVQSEPFVQSPSTQRPHVVPGRGVLPSHSTISPSGGHATHLFFRQISPKTHASRGSGSPLELDPAVVAEVDAVDVELASLAVVASPLVLSSPVVGDVESIVSASPVLGDGRGSGTPQP